MSGWGSFRVLGGGIVPASSWPDPAARPQAPSYRRRVRRYGGDRLLALPYLARPRTRGGVERACAQGAHGVGIGGRGRPAGVRPGLWLVDPRAVRDRGPEPRHG